MRLIEVSTGTDLAPVGRGAVMLVEREVGRLPQVRLHVEHKYAPGIYTRHLYIPKGTVLAGKIHKYEHFNIVLVGTIEVLTESGVRKLVAPAMFKSPAGIKRAGYTFEDTIWVTVHPNPTDEHDIDKLEKLLTVDTFEELKEHIIDGEIIE